MNEDSVNREDRINALLDGELSKADAGLLKAEASDDRELARAIVEACQLQQAMEDVHVERAPASLRKRLLAIPRSMPRTTLGQQRSALRWTKSPTDSPAGSWWSSPVSRAIPALSFPRLAALAAIPLVLIVVSLMRPDMPSADEIAEARQELAIAFAYIDKASDMTGREIQSKVGQTVANAVTGSVNSAIKSQKFNTKEKQA